MKITRSTEGNIAVMRLQGRFDVTVRPDIVQEVRDALSEPAIREVRLDLGQIDFIDSAALGILLLWRSDATTAGKTISLAGVAGTVGQVLEIANFGRLFDFR